jgi:hypothetical protein
MTDPRDLESSLAEMDRKLRELQRELELLPRPPEPGAGSEAERGPEPPPAALPPPPAAPPAASPAGTIEHAAERVAELGRRIDALADLRKELDQATSALQEEQRHAATREASQ